MDSFLSKGFQPLASLDNGRFPENNPAEINSEIYCHR
jgi:hypothetical protein